MSNNLLEQFTAEINRYFFLREYSFERNQFRTSLGESELADHIIDLPDALFVFQLKERSSGAPSDSKSIEAWFRRKVLDKGCGQIAASIRYFQERTNLRILNQRGHMHELSLKDRLVVPIILYSTGTANSRIDLPRHRVSKRAGFVHLMHLRDYHNVCRVLGLPSELIGYFRFRQDLLLRRPHDRFEEAILTAMFIDENTQSVSDERAREILQAAYDDTISFDIGEVLRRFGEKVTYLSGGGADLDYYKILAEFSRLSRAEMRGFKKLFIWALDNIRACEPQIPARMMSISTGTGFVVFPVPVGALTGVSTP